jgi:hypothetical protein
MEKKRRNKGKSDIVLIYMNVTYLKGDGKLGNIVVIVLTSDVVLAWCLIPFSLSQSLVIILSRKSLVSLS